MSRSRNVPAAERNERRLYSQAIKLLHLPLEYAEEVLPSQFLISRKYNTYNKIFKTFFLHYVLHTVIPV